MFIIGLVLVGSLAAAPAAWAYSESDPSANPDIDPSDCESCHTGTPEIAGTEEARQGPHANYSATSRSCYACHQVHQAYADGYLLMPGATTTETCELCHDGTGGKGVYGALEARGLAVASQHRTEVTTQIPGGDEATGGMATAALSGYQGTLSCGDCHSPHGGGTVEPFTTDRSRIETDVAGFFSNQLLRRAPTGATYEIGVYGSDWCAACHSGRASGVHDLINHPVDTSATVGPTAFTYESVQVVDGVDSPQTVQGSLGRSNFGYVMPWPRTAGQGTHAPVCQQCHEDGRSVGDVASGRIKASEVFTVTSADGGTAGDNPRFQNFPHESYVENLLIESYDDLCSNCHHPNQLP
ncbi:MAG: cytochrome c3 family protein [Anaerosomatales bacterium]|nr:cytochrome c3 family protein [Anaerosomatales bacterium]